MTQLDVLPPVEYDLNYLPPSATLPHVPAPPACDSVPIDVSVPGLPPLFHGHPDLHMNNGIISANHAGSTGEEDSEKAFFVADLSQVWRQHQRWKRALPDVEPFYAVKCNPDPYVLRLLKALGTGFDCASQGEISQVLSIGVDASRIIFANPCKPASFIRHAAKSDVALMTFDNTDELHKVARLYPGAKLVVRILTDDSSSLCRLGVKFGAPLADVPRLLACARGLNLNVVGVSFHVGSGCSDPNAFQDAIMRAHRAFAFGREAGYQFTLLDVGGGFEDLTFERSARAISDALAHYFPKSERETAGIRVIAEPGRFYVSTAFNLACNIIARRVREGDDEALDDDNETPRVMYYINDGVYGSFNCILFDHQVVYPHVLTVNGSFVSSTTASADLELCSVWGPTCDGIDCVSPVTRLPRALEVGDWLGFRNMGAYTICAASQFNGFKTSDVVYTSGVGVDSAAVRRALVSTD
ncbi:hypothetical protein EXIGLDRAFT_109488 [Exidia glandulosa HHB12029]|uniref:ornithine decarboxylase n=1 Tax=Exidia glandulosa HHB12029 TaxID=1314781 RepID=A0A165GQI4_EXIGL|nr:hypothetical protein EXIGLDRAFT_109488 [Exidia glandulosa HHB12029]